MSSLHERTNAVCPDGSNRDAFVWGLIVHSFGQNQARPVTALAQIVDDAVQAMAAEGIGGGLDACAMRELVASQLIELSARSRARAEDFIPCVPLNCEQVKAADFHTAVVAGFESNQEVSL